MIKVQDVWIYHLKTLIYKLFVKSSWSILSAWNLLEPRFQNSSLYWLLLYFCEKTPLPKKLTKKKSLNLGIMVPGNTIIYDHNDKNHGSSRQSWHWISIWDFTCWDSNHEAKIEPNGMAQDFESSKPTTSDITSPIKSYFLILPKIFHQLGTKY